MARALPPWLHEQQSSETSTQSSSFLQSGALPAGALPPARLASARHAVPSMSPTSAVRDRNKVSRVSAVGLRPKALDRGGSKGPSEGPFLDRLEVRIARKYTWHMPVPQALRIWFIVHGVVDL